MCKVAVSLKLKKVAQAGQGHVVEVTKDGQRSDEKVVGPLLAEEVEDRWSTWDT